MVRDARCGSVTAPAGRSIKRYADPTRLGDRRAERAIRQDGLGCRADVADRGLRSRQRRRPRAFAGASSKGRAPLKKRFGQLLDEPSVQRVHGRDDGGHRRIAFFRPRLFRQFAESTASLPQPPTAPSCTLAESSQPTLGPLTFAAQSAYDGMVGGGAPYRNPKAASAPRFSSTTFYPAGFRVACSPIAGPPPEASRIERLTFACHSHH